MFLNGEMLRSCFEEKDWDGCGFLSASLFVVRL